MRFFKKSFGHSARFALANCNHLNMAGTLVCCPVDKVNNHHLKAGGIKTGGLNRQLKGIRLKAGGFKRRAKRPVGRVETAFRSNKQKCFFKKRMTRYKGDIYHVNHTRRTVILFYAILALITDS